MELTYGGDGCADMGDREGVGYVEDGVILRDVVYNEGGSGGALEENPICLTG